MVAFVLDYRCGTAPGLHRIPFTQQQQELLQTDSNYHIQCTVILSTLNIVFFARIRKTGYQGWKSHFYYEFWLFYSHPWNREEVIVPPFFGYMMLTAGHYDSCDACHN